MLKLYLLVVALLFVMQVDGQIIALDNSTELPLDISRQACCFVDSTAVLSLAEVQSKDFRPVKISNFRVPYSDAAYWYRFTLRNDGPAKNQWFVSWDNHVVELVEYIQSENEKDKVLERGGSLVPLSERNYRGLVPGFTIDLGAGQQQTVYLRVKSQRGHRVDLYLHDLSSLYTTQLNAATRTGFASGMVFLRLFFVLLLAIFVVREATFRAYSFMLVMRSVGYWGLIGVLGATFTQQAVIVTRLDFLAYHLIPIGYVVAVWFLLPLRRLPAWVRYALASLVAAVVGLGILIGIDYRWQWLLASQYLVLFAQCFVFGLYLYTILRRWPVNWYYSVPFLLGIGSYFFIVLGSVSMIDAAWVFSLAYLMFVGEIFLFGLFLGKIIIDYRRQRETARRELIFKEEQAARLRELDTLKTNFFADISHEFRTPLTMLVGPLEDFRQQYPSNGLIPTMQRNVRRLQTLIDQLLDLTRLEAGHLRPNIVRADLPAFLRHLFASFESLAQSRRVVFSHQQNFDHREGCFDPDKLEKIVTNLLSNAFKFTPEGGRVTVRAEFDDTNLTLRVQDYGIGIEAARLPHIFDRFYRVEDTAPLHAQGTGIGLALVRELVRTLRGEIGVTSESGRGTIFTLTLPIDDITWANQSIQLADSSIAVPQPNQTELTATGKSTVTDNALAHPDPDAPLLLLVEDNPDLREYMRHVFQEDYRLIEAADGQEGLDLAFEEIPDLAVCDVMMPRLDGCGFCKKLKSDPRTSHIPVIMLTARGYPRRPPGGAGTWSRRLPDQTFPPHGATPAGAESAETARITAAKIQSANGRRIELPG